MAEHEAPGAPEGMSPKGAEIVAEYRKHRRRTNILNGILIGCVALFLVAAAYILATIREGRAAAEERDHAISIMQGQLELVCKQAPNVKLAESGKQVCKRAEREQLPPQITIIQGQEGPRGTEGEKGEKGDQGQQGERGRQGKPGKRGPGPTQEQVQRAVDLHCAQQPGGTCEAPGPTRAQVFAAVIDFCADGRCRGDTGDKGDKGDKGEPGDPPTREQVRSVVDAYCAEQPGGTCKGEKGDKGDQGPRGYYPDSVKFEDREDGCYLVLTLNDPNSTELSVELPRRFCIPPPDDE